MKQRQNISRRQFLYSAALAGSALCLTPRSGIAVAAELNRKPIPTNGEMIPVVGMGTWRTFNIGSDPRLLQQRTRLMRRFFELGGGMIDSSPMYGSAADVVGHALAKLTNTEGLFSAEKVWSPAGGTTLDQFDSLSQRWGVDNFDLLQVHNLQDWKAHLTVLQELKANKKIRYVGITTSHGRRHSDLERIMKTENIDFVQLTYNLTHREVEQRLLPVAMEHGIAVIANRPFDGGYLVKGLKKKGSIPDWAEREFNCTGWADFLLKFIVSHPALTVAIPATSKLAHLEENMSALTGPLPDLSLRQKMISYVEAM